jgi:hypothetical protein
MFMEEEDILDEHETALVILSASESRISGKILTPCATVEKNPFKILAAKKLLKLVAAEHQAAVKNAKITK